MQLRHTGWQIGMEPVNELVGNSDTAEADADECLRGVAGAGDADDVAAELVHLQFAHSPVRN
jgi:hypothetical protein